MKYLALTVFALVAGAAFADGGACCAVEAKAKVAPKHGEGCCEATVAQGHAGCEDGTGMCCAEKLLNSEDPAVREQAFWAMANAMKASAPVVAEKAAAAEKACCAEEEMMAKEEETCGGNCCKIDGLAKFKVFAGGKYYFYGCPGSAAMGREELNSQGLIAGKVQAVVGKHRL